MIEQLQISRVSLRVRNLASAVEFYRRVLGLKVFRHEGGVASFGAPGQHEPFLTLVEDRDALAQSRSAAGLFHTAYRFPSRRDLAHAFSRLMEIRYPIEGASNHLVSEAIYLSDPEGNGIELYADSPREVWQWHDGQVVMATKRLNLEALLANIAGEPVPAMVSPGTEIGHLHLQVIDLSSAQRFYSDFLGLDVTSRDYPGALFFSAGGYHHHIGANVWGQKTELPSAEMAGLISYRIELSGSASITELHNRAVDFGCFSVGEIEAGTNDNILRLQDPCGACLELSVRTVEV